MKGGIVLGARLARREGDCDETGRALTSSMPSETAVVFRGSEVDELSWQGASDVEADMCAKALWSPPPVSQEPTKPRTSLTSSSSTHREPPAWR